MAERRSLPRMTISKVHCYSSMKGKRPWMKASLFWLLTTTNRFQSIACPTEPFAPAQVVTAVSQLLNAGSSTIVVLRDL